MRKAYQTDPTDAELGCLESLLPAPKTNGRPRLYPIRHRGHKLSRQDLMGLM
jgi:hypothetical protein